MLRDRTPLRDRAARAAALGALALIVPILASPVTASAAPTQTWTTSLATVGSSTFSSVSCPTTSTCTAVGGGPWASIYRTDDGGATWTLQLAPPATPALDLVSCPTASFCLATSDLAVPIVDPTDVLATTDGGATWTVVGSITSEYAYVDDLQCVSSTACYALSGGTVAESADGGRTWSEPVGAEGTNSLAMSCPSAATCLTAGWSLVDATSDTWSYEVEAWDGGGPGAVEYSHVWHVPQGRPVDQGISCSSPRVCMAVGDGPGGGLVVTTTDAGKVWRTRPMHRGLSRAEAVSCARGARCAIVFARHGVIDEARTSVGRPAWTTHGIASTPDASFPGSISCPVDSRCHLVGFDTAADGLYAQSAATALWSRTALSTGSQPLWAAACPSSTECLATGDGVAMTSSDGGETWTSSTSPPIAGATPTAIACATAAVCVESAESDLPYAGGGVAVLDRTTDAGATWAEVTIPSGDTRLADMTCTSTTTCMAVGEGSVPVLRTTDGGATWAAAPLPGTSVDLTSVSCGTATTCVAVGGTDAGNLIATSSDAGATWTVTVGRPSFSSSTPSVPELIAVSCTSATTCAAVGVAAPNFDAYETGSFATSDGGQDWTEQSTSLAPDGRTMVCAATTCQELATPLEGSLGPSTAATSYDDGATWSAVPLPATAVRVTAVTTVPGGGWLAVGGDATNGALALTG